jgi:DNA-binding response OmpR family regulator
MYRGSSALSSSASLSLRTATRRLPSKSVRYDFGGAKCADTARNCLSIRSVRGKRRLGGAAEEWETHIKLQEQPCRMLVALLENPGEVITREELRSRLWPGDTGEEQGQGEEQ